MSDASSERGGGESGEESVERLREILFEQQQALERERARRVRAEAMLEGLERLLTIDDVVASFDRLVEVARPLIGFEHAMLLIPSSDDRSVLVTNLATVDSLVGAEWQIGGFFDRVLGGEASACFDVKFIKEWEHALAGAGEERPPIRSALHVAINGLGSTAMFVCVHRERAFFSADHLERIKLLTPLASQILINLEHRRARQAEESARWHLDLLSRAAQALGVGVAVSERRRVLEDPNSVLVAFAQPWGSVQAWWSAMREHAPTGELSQRFDVTSPAGEREIIESHWVPLPDDRWLLLLQDVKRWVLVEERLHTHAQALSAARDEARQASRAKSAFLASVSHELRTPLNAIIGYGELIVEETDEPGLAYCPKEDLERILNAANHLLELIGDVLDLSQIEAGRMVISRADVGLDDLIEEIVAMVEPLVKHRGNVLVVDREEGLPRTVRVDLGKTRQVLLNILSNAAKFTDHGTITLRVACNGEALVFAVEDTGVGIAAADFGRLFEVFERVNGGFDETEGTGLGLALARQITREMGGDIDVTSELGAGSVFTVRLPLCQDG